MADETPQDDDLPAEIDETTAAVEASLGDAPADASTPASDIAADDPSGSGASDAADGAEEGEDVATEAAPDDDATPASADEAAEEPEGPGLGARVVEFARTKPRMAIVIVIGFVVLVVIMRLTACAPPPPAHTFWTVAAPEYAELAASARMAATTIAQASNAGDMEEIQRMATDELEAVEGVAETIDGMHFSDGEIPMRNAMIEAVAAQRDFLAHVVRVTKLAPRAAAAQVPALAESAEEMHAMWEAFLEMVHQAPPSIIHTGLVEKVEELRGALGRPAPATETATADDAAAPDRTKKDASSDRVYVGGDGFRAGAVACGTLMGHGVLCEATDGSAVRLYPDDGAVAVARPVDGPLRENFRRGTEWADAGGGIACSVTGKTVRCMNPVGQGFDFGPGVFTPLSRANS